MKEDLNLNSEYINVPDPCLDGDVYLLLGEIPCRVMGEHADVKKITVEHMYDGAIRKFTSNTYVSDILGDILGYNDYYLLTEEEFHHLKNLLTTSKEPQ